MKPIDKIRNVALIAHVDHGKTTLVDQLLRHAKVFAEHQEIEERVMDQHDLERQRGITIFAKNCAVDWRGHRINLIDTPGHADFGGEVERVLRMADAALMLVCAHEGPMPQTRFVLRKALLHGLKLLLVVNKVDRQDARPQAAGDEVLELLIDLDGGDEVLETPVIFASARHGQASEQLEDFGAARDIGVILDKIVDTCPAPQGQPDGAFQMAVSQVEYDKYLGPIASGRIQRGQIQSDSKLIHCSWKGPSKAVEIKKIFSYEGIAKFPTDVLGAGDIAAIAGLEEVKIGDTLCAHGHPDPIKPVTIEAPTVAMRFMATNSPFRGREGQLMTSRQLRERLEREAQSNVALRVTPTENADQLEVAGRGILHLGILIEEMRREGYEFQISQPRVLEQRGEHGEVLEPIELCVVDVPEDYVGKIIDILGPRRGELKTVTSLGTLSRLTFEIPTRGLIGVGSWLLHVTRGECTMHRQFLAYQPMKGAIPTRKTGVQIARETGQATSYALEGLEERGPLFVRPGQDVYMGQIVGEHCRDDDIEVNVCKKKGLTNVRSAFADRKLLLAPATVFSVEEALEYIAADELVEITPQSIRMRKLHLVAKDRRKANKVKVDQGLCGTRSTRTRVEQEIGHRIQDREAS